MGQKIFWGSKWAWRFTSVMFVLNNVFIMGFHCLVGAKYLNTITNHGLCTVTFSAIAAIVSWFCSLPRTFNTLSRIAATSASFTFVSVVLAMVFAGIEDQEKSYDSELAKPVLLTFPAAGTSYIAGMNAFLNIAYTFVGQITIPSFIAEMKEPKDFPKALWVVTIAEVIFFTLAGSIIYVYTGSQSSAGPAFGSLDNELFRDISFSFMIPTMIFLGVLYASVTVRFVFFRLFAGTRHSSSHTIVGWTSWAAILAALWVGAFLVAEVIPFFSDLLSLMSSLFDSFFGFTFWGLCHWRMTSEDRGPGFWKSSVRGFVGMAFDIFLLIAGLFLLTGGTYASARSIIDGYNNASSAGAFSCASNGL